MTRPKPLAKRLYIRGMELLVDWMRAQDERKRELAARAIMKWVGRRSDDRRLNTAIVFSAACSDYPIVLRLIEWILSRPKCSAEMVLFYLGRLQIHQLASLGWTEQSLRADPQYFAFVDGLVSGLRDGRYTWRGPFRSDNRTLVTQPVASWSGVSSLQYCDLYGELDTERPPARILDAFETLGSYSGERVGKIARKVLVEKGYDPKTQPPPA